jgi:outer membrane protein OmpA-like peptidoglycan-associated protein/tetratricopeptide (TPR) repeat protein
MTSAKRYVHRSISLVVMLCLVTCWASGQNRNSRKAAEQYLDSHRYQEAIEVLEAYCPTRPKDFEAWLWLARARFETNQCEEALRLLQMLEEEHRKGDIETTLLRARIHHQLHQFSEAIEYYKRFLANGIRDPRYAGVVNEVKRCATGLRYNFISDEVLVENMGSDVNSRFDDIAPVESPNYHARIYFSSTRALRIQDRFNEDGTLRESVQGYDTDMFGTEILNGAWAKSQVLNPRLNTSQHEVLQDFSKDGMVLFFNRSDQINSGQIWVDTFDMDELESLGRPWHDGPFLPGEQVRGIFFFNDSTLFFSSDQREGFGGYDLYYCRKKADGWSAVTNLGDRINTAFDEVTPFLCRDGRTLFFSSNRLQSMGGFDIFQTRYNERSNQWEDPGNLGRPLNSAGNDLFYRISANGLMAFFSSDRKTGAGGHDIYSAYYKQPQHVNLMTSVPLLFSEVRDFQLFNQSLVDLDDDPATMAEKAMAVFDMPYLLYRDDQVVTPQNKPKLEKLAGLLQTYPHVILEVICHSDQTAVSNFDLFFAIKRAEQIGTFLGEQGIKPSSVYLKGLGGNYPLAKNEIEGKDNETGRYYNRRIDFRIHGYEQLPLRINYLLPEFMENMRDFRLDQYYERVKGLTYRVEFAVLDQLYKGDLIGKYPDSMIEKNPDSDSYIYCSGLFDNFNQALTHLSQIKKEGFSGARIIPYMDGIRRSNTGIDENLMREYPDLRNYMLYIN